jgi:hypothetical protein
MNEFLIDYWVDRYPFIWDDYPHELAKIVARMVDARIKELSA